MTEPTLDLLLCAVVGSIAYGLDHAESDTDLLGVYRTPTIELLGINGPDHADHSIVSTKPDITHHELGKFARLALAANPTVTEVLWADTYTTRTSDGEELINARSLFLSSSRVTNAYIGYALGQARRLQRRKDDPSTRAAKHARHCARLLLQARQLLSTGELILNVGEHRSRLIDIGEDGAKHPERFLAWAEKEARSIESSPSVLPDTPDTETVNSIVQSLRLKNLPKY